MLNIYVQKCLQGIRPQLQKGAVVSLLNYCIDFTLYIFANHRHTPAQLRLFLLALAHSLSLTQLNLPSNKQVNIYPVFTIPLLDWNDNNKQYTNDKK